MRFILPEVIVTVGAFLGSVRDFTSRPDPGGYANLVYRGSGTLRTARNHLVTPLLNVDPSSFSLGFVSSKSTFVRVRPSTRVKTSRVASHAALNRVFPASISAYSTHPNITWLSKGESSGVIAFTVLPYDGPKGLTRYDDRRTLATYGYNGPRELTLYYRPTELMLYAAPINYVQFWVDPRHYQVVTYIYRPRFVTGTYLAKDYAHLDPTNFERWTVENPIDALLARERSYPLEIFFLVPSRHLTIGKFERRFEEKACWALSYLFALGALLALAVIAFEEYTKFQKALEQGQSGALANLSSSDGELLVLPRIMHQISNGQEPLDAATGSSWWKIEDNGTRKTGYSTSTSFLELPIITASKPTSTPPPISAHVPTPPEAPQDLRPSYGLPKALPARPSGPRFKTAAWRRCRVK
ncbi:hypothetical protein OPQ81_003681 [Rhizoctonia solani]|nr:hypothetical protein OPQ81_003681 [Rhizoctonia solani]